VSHRRFKHLLGETELERKCRFLFGMIILSLVGVSFFWYGQKIESLVRKQTTQTARALIGPVLLNVHINALGNKNFEPIRENLAAELKPKDDLPRHDAWVLDPENTTDPGKQPRDDFERGNLARFIRSAAARKLSHSPEEQHTFADGTPTWGEQITKGQYHYVQAVFFKPGCLVDCHGNDGQGDNHLHKRAPDRQRWVKTEPDDLAGAVVVSLPMEQTTRAINGNRATLISFALVTSILAMVSSYLAIHYVVVRPAGAPHRLRRDQNADG
jgi:two-component system, NarL family, sensor histidine kinase BarA